MIEFGTPDQDEHHTNVLGGVHGLTCVGYRITTSVQLTQYTGISIDRPLQCLAVGARRRHQGPFSDHIEPGRRLRGCHRTKLLRSRRMCGQQV